MLTIQAIVWNTGSSTLRRTNYRAVGYCLYLFKARTVVMLGNKKIIAPENSLFLFEPNIEHSFCEITAQWQCDFVQVYGAEIADILKLLKLPLNAFFSIDAPSYISSVIKKITRETIRDYEFRQAMLDFMIRELFIKIAVAYHHISSNTPSIPDKYVSELKSIRKEMCEHPEYDWNLSNMAKKLNLTETYFRKLYREYHGISPKKDLINIRIKHAEYLLNCKGLPVREVATLVGYSSEYHFSRIFKQYVGTSPGTFLLSHRGGDVVDN